MQINGGTVTVAIGSGTVTGSSDCDWSEVTVNNWFLVSGQIYLINAVDNSLKTLGISPTFAGVGGLDLTDSSNYTIVRDFTANHQLPILNPGDLEAASLWSRAMNIIDGLLGGAGGDTEIAISKVGHGFVVGNVIRYDTSSGWTLADAGSKTNATIVGVVSTVVDADNFKFKTEGKITGVSGLSSVTAGTVYYLRATAASPNLVETAPSRVVPVMVMISDTEGYIMSLATNDAGVFALLTNGLVPGPATTSGNFLRDDGSWAASVVAGDSLTTTEHQKTGTVNWTSFLANGNTLSLIKHIQDLHTRLLAVEGAVSTVDVSRTVYTRRNGNLTGVDGAAWTYTFNLPAGVTRVRATIISGTFPYWYLTQDESNYRTPQYVWDALLGNRNPTAQAGYGYRIVNSPRPVPIAPNAYVAYLVLGAEQELTVEVGPLLSLQTDSATAKNYAKIYSGATELASVYPGVQPPVFGASLDGVSFYHATDPHNIIGELVKAFEFKSSSPSANQWGNGYNNLTGMVILEYGGYIETSF